MSSNILILRNQFINKNAPLQNGIGRFIPQLARITIKFCKNYGNSNGVRQFIEEDVVNFAKFNPSVVVYLKPRRHRAPVIVAEYLNGERHWQSLHNKTAEEVSAWVDFYRNHSGREYSDQFKYTYSDYPSIQGIWNPHTNQEPRDPSVSVVGEAPTVNESSATQTLRALFASQQQAASQSPGEKQQLEKSRQTAAS